MARRVKAVSHEDRLSLVEHLDELRWRIVVCIAVLVVALALCFWQNRLLLEVAAGPLPSDHKQLIAFSYWAVMPAAVEFLLGFNESQFNAEPRARDYYGFFAMTMLAGALVFQLS